MKTLFILIILIGIITANAQAGDFTTIKNQLAAAFCTEFDFLTIIESEVFERTDSIKGQACLARDGRYLIDAGDDSYLFDGEYLFSHSAANNQVTVEQLDTNIYRSEEISFITGLDDLYTTTVIADNATFSLVKKEGMAINAPDSMLVTIDTALSRITQFDYLDINEEANRIIILDQKLTDSCRTDQFLPHFPDSVEMVKLY